jgi:hypothetical protein
VGYNHGRRSELLSPLIERWDGSQWRVQSAVGPGDEALLNDVDALASGRVWAVGAYRVGGRVHPLIEEKC